MRVARLGDYRRRVTKGASQWDLSITRFSFDSVPGLGTGEIPFVSPFSIVSGANGVGKTTVLRAIWAATSGSEAQTGDALAVKLRSGAIAVDFSWKQAGGSTAASFSSGKIVGAPTFPVDVVYLDTSTEPLKLQRSCCSYNDVDDLINGEGVRPLDATELEQVNYISRRDYREIKIIEIELDDTVFPFFEVVYGGEKYDSRTMGAGEIAILYLWWAIDRLSNNALLLVEEPETFLSPASQEALAHYLLGVTVEKKLTTIITSHSWKIIGSVPDNHHVYLYRNGAATKVVSGSPTPALLKTLGFEAPKDTLIFVEDVLAKEFVTRILDRHKARLSRRSEIVVKNGDANVTAALSQLAGLQSAIRFIAVYDGDVRGAVEERFRKFSAFLPGDQPVEKMFRDMLQVDAKPLSTALGRDDIDAILFSIEGDEHHEWYNNLCKGLMLTREQLFPILFGVWERSEGSDQSTTKMLEEIGLALGEE